MGEQGQEGAEKSLLDLDLEQLAKTPVVVPSMDIPVTTVAREQSTVGRSPAAVFVITQEMIRRSGATCIPEVLRIAPGLEVAQINSSRWCISARGFNGRFANKLLVLIDGRSVYTPVNSGVYWDVQDLLLEDVERIEVVRGPGGTLWGANAVNGVINILTKSAKDTQGTYVSGGGGTHERFNDAFRHGGKIGEDGSYRIYGKYFERGPGVERAGPFNTTTQGNDAWCQGRVGFRTDWGIDPGKSDALTVQGDYYRGSEGDSATIVQTVPPYSQTYDVKNPVEGGNVLARWRHTIDDESDFALQTYFDRYSRIEDVVSETVNTLDLDFQYRFPLTDRQRITCGVGFRNVSDELLSADDFTEHYTPACRTTNLASQFLQDEIALVEDRLTLTLGTKLEQNAYTGFECQPTARMLWSPDRRHSLWGAVSRAVRTPSRWEDDLFKTMAMGGPPPGPSPGPGPFDVTFLRLYGSRGVLSEALMAYEIGYREQTTDRLSWDLALFYNVYDRLVTLKEETRFWETYPLPAHWVDPQMFVNLGAAQTYGVELAGNWTVSERWRLYSQYTFLRLHTERQRAVSGDPRHQVYFRSAWDLGRDWEFDLMVRYVDAILGIGTVPSYITMDLRLAWRPRKHFEFAVVGQNLLQSHHWESSGLREDQVTEVPRGVYGTITYRR